MFDRQGITVTALGIPHGNLPTLAYRVHTRDARRLIRLATYLFEQAVVEETLRISILGFRVIEELE